MVSFVDNQYIYSSSDHRRRRRRDHFPEGSSIEVRTDEPGLEGAYYAATVIPPPPGTAIPLRKRPRKQLYVEYASLLDEGGSELLREFVDASCVRPLPPNLVEEEESDRIFCPEEAVDVLHEDGWWTGVVSRVVEGGKRVVVKFLNPPEENEYGIADVRAHWDWVDGVWVKQQSAEFIGSMYGVGRSVEISLEEGCRHNAWIPAIIHKYLGDCHLLVEYDAKRDGDVNYVKAKVDLDCVRPCPPVLDGDERRFVASENVDAFFDFTWWSGVVTRELENNRYIVFLKQFKECKEFSQWELRPHMEWKDGKWLLQTFSDEGVGEEIQPLRPRNRKFQSDSEAVEKVSEGGNAVQVSTEAEENQIDGNELDDDVRQSLRSCVQGKTGLELPSLLFEKTSVLWEVIESEEVFRRIPQKPHFQHLGDYRESLREGFAVGFTISFVNLVNRACGLKLSDPKTVIENEIKLLGDFEMHGFDVSLLRDRLTKLLGLKAKVEENLYKVNSFNKHLQEHNLVKSRIEEEIRGINEQMSKLREKLSLAESAKEKEDAEITLLQDGLNETVEIVKTVECDFKVAPVIDLSVSVKIFSLPRISHIIEKNSMEEYMGQKPKQSNLQEIILVSSLFLSLPSDDPAKPSTAAALL